VRASREQVVAALRFLADGIMQADGDRDHLNQSNLLCEQTQNGARVLREIADWLEGNGG
jgi:hypothetical protein